MISFVDVLVAAAFVLIIADVIFQIKKVRGEHDSRDISMHGAFVRLIALAILLVKFVLLGESVLLVGQLVLVGVFVCYIFVLKHYHKKQKKGRKK